MKKTRIFNGVKYQIRPNTAADVTKKQLEKLALYGKEKGLISNYRIVKEDKSFKLYIKSI